MSRTLNLIDVLLTTGRNLFQMGRYADAVQTLSRLSEFRGLPMHVFAQVQALLGEICLHQAEYRQARRHLAIAIGARPLKATNHHLMAVAIEEDEYADHAQAERHFAEAARLEPDQPRYWADFGSYLFSIDKPRQGLGAIRKAHALAAHDPDIVGQIAEVLRRAGLHEEAATRLRHALFANHGNLRFRQLWQDHQYQMMYLAQEMKRDAQERNTGRPVLLPFTPGPSQGKYAKLGSKTIRIDQAESLSEPRGRKPLPQQRPPKG